jgi:hypothetical protein
MSFCAGDVKKKWKSTLRHQQQQICNSLRANHSVEGGYHEDSNSNEDQFSYDNVSQSSYGSHKNRNFESRSHRGSISDDQRNQDEHEKLALLMMNGGGKN